MGILVLVAVAAGVAIYFRNPFAKRSSEPCVSRLDAAMFKAAHEVTDGKEPARTAVIDLALPVDDAEVRKLNHMGILSVRVFVRDPKSLPLVGASVGLTEQKMVVNLPPIFPKATVFEVTPGSMIARKLGQWYQDEFYFLPLRILGDKGKIHLVFNSKQSTLPVADLPLPADRLAKIRGRTAEDPNVRPDPKLVAKKLAESLCFSDAGG